MANSVLKWCKTKLFNGYKPINVSESNDCLVRKESMSDVHYGPSPDEDILLRSQTSLNDNHYPTMSLDRTQDTHFSESSESLTPNRDFHRHESKTEASLNDSCEGEEFAFTLYDFHGQGRVTKSDIRNLVRNIYKTVGSSTSMPSSGSRTVKVKVMVTDENVESQETKNDHRQEGLSSEAYREINQGPATHSLNDNLENIEYQPDNTELPDNRNDRQIHYQNIYLQESHKSSSHLHPFEHTRDDCLTNAPTELIEAEIENDEMSSHDQEKSPRKVYYRRQDLLQIIEANMEKNNLYCPVFKKASHSKLTGSRRRKRNQNSRQNNNCRCNVQNHIYENCPNSTCLDCTDNHDSMPETEDTILTLEHKHSDPDYSVFGIKDTNTSNLRRETKKNTSVVRHDSLRYDSKSVLKNTRNFRCSSRSFDRPKPQTNNDTELYQDIERPNWNDVSNKYISNKSVQVIATLKDNFPSEVTQYDTVINDYSYKDETGPSEVEHGLKDPLVDSTNNLYPEYYERDNYKCEYTRDQGMDNFKSSQSDSSHSMNACGYLSDSSHQQYQCNSSLIT